MEDLFRYQRSSVFRHPDDPLVVEYIPRQGICPAHEHDFIEIMLAVGGVGIQETADSKRPIRQGTLTVVRTGHWHAYSRCRKLSLYNCCFGSELLRNELSWLLDDPCLARLLWGCDRDPKRETPEILQLNRGATSRLKGLLDELSQPATSVRGVQIARLTVFLTVLSEILAVQIPRARASVPPFVRQCILAMEKDLAHPWTVRGLAQQRRCSAEYLIRSFHAAMGMSPYAYLSRCRAERAASLLLGDSRSIANIAESVGWPEPSHFSRSFKQHYRVSPRMFREQGGRGRKSR